METAPQLILDIGTHKVLGLAVHPTADGVHVLASSMHTHTSRAMRDGQVHDVPAVARTVRTVIDEIEGGLASNVIFKEAYIAAAGRALHTAPGKAELVETRPVLFTGAMQRALEWDAVADAQANLLAALPRSEHSKGFYCIAHTRTASHIDEEPIASLVDQRGSQFSVDVLATFLPGIVVDSLQAVLRSAGLVMRGLTLEPVAALEAVVPESMRHLRLMLVDIGAGTTDIAFTGNGSVQAYAMVPSGGDSITEALANELLLDFTVAEQAKQAVARGASATAHNVLGDAVVIDNSTLLDIIEPATMQLARSVGHVAETWELDKAPDAVLLVGGGSKTPRLSEKLSEELKLPLNRIAVRDRGAVRAVTGGDKLQGPDVVTALGIALRFAGDQEAPPVRVRINGRPVSLFQPERCTVREAARIAGLPLNHLVGRLGQGMTVTVNGELVVIPGHRGQTAMVRVNGEPAELDMLLETNDDVELQLPADGDSARITVDQLISRWQRQRHEATGEETPRIEWNGTRLALPLFIERRGEPVDGDDTVLDRDEFEFRRPQTIAELLDAMAADVSAEQAAASESEPSFEKSVERPFTIILNGTPSTIHLPADVRLNGVPVGHSARIEDGDRIDMDPRGSVALYELLSHPTIDALRQSGAGPRKLTLLVRGEPAGFTTVVRAGDTVDIRYE